MTSRLLMPGRGRRADVRTSDQVQGSTRATAILDRENPLIVALTARARTEGTAGDALRTAHGIIAREVRPVYSVEDRRRASRTLRLGRGSCSQRMAVLEAVARGIGVRTRVRGLLVDGAFWYPRFPRLKPLVPEHVLLAWPEFRLDGAWVPIGELFRSTPRGGAFTNEGGETLFDAVSRTSLHWDTPTSCGAPGTTCDLSARVRTDLGYFDDRDDLFTHHGQTLCRTARTLGEPVLGRWSAGAGTAA
ncbi:transglutaminase domain-containing protein [Streptomyces sp. NPDC002845]